MFDKAANATSSKSTAFQLAVECVHQYCLYNAFYNKKELISLVLFGTQSFQNSGDFPGIFQVNELETVSFQLLNILETYKQLDYQKFNEKFHFSHEHTFPNLLWTIMTIFSGK